MKINSEASDRDHVLDFTKGILVITMVAYHVLNYYLSGYHTIYAYAGYVTLAFIFYSGFVCGTIYFKKYLDNRASVYRRLMIRGLKLILLFVIVNIIIHGLFQKNYNGQDLGLRLLFDNLASILLSGNGRIADFPVLLPIGYVLLISAPLINISKTKYIFYALLLAIFLITSILKIHLVFNLAGVLTGVGGLLSGLIYNEKKNVLNRNAVKYMGIVLLLLFLFILIPSGIDPRKYFVVYYLYINVVIFNLHLLGRLLNPSRILTNLIIMFGQYSLFLYLAQIIILQLLKIVLDFRLPSVTIDHFLIFIVVNILLVGICYFTGYLRSKFVLSDRVYRFIFA